MFLIFTCIYTFIKTQRSSSSRSSATSSITSKMPNVLRTGNKKIGLAFIGSGLLFTFLGITLFFNKNLMRMGNLLFICGIPLSIGPGRTVGYFLQPKKARATGCLIVGILLVFVGHPILGILLEVFGLLNLFGNMFPVLMVLVKQLPFVGGLFDGGNKKGSGGGRKQRSSRQEEEQYYGGGGGDRYYDDRYEDDGRGDDRYY
mmetsp:Transcript_9081/g.11536  ORF Transcript_9081/g.11536 Transcript_9081/m.11536 type:complete len:202 (-) Transcript_9081:54-659(-)